MDDQTKIMFAAIVAGLLIPLLYVIGAANRLARLRNHIKESWSDVDVQLQRRHDLIPNLVETVKAYAAHEQELFTRIAQEREQAMASRMDIAQYAQNENELGRSVNALLARVESYPELRSSRHYLELQEELANTEDRIAAARRFYNANVRDYNTMLESFPSSVVGSSMGHVRAPMFNPNLEKMPGSGGSNPS